MTSVLSLKVKQVSTTKVLDMAERVFSLKSAVDSI
jgi:hypothetical protein